MSSELSCIIRESEYQNEIPADFPKVTSGTQEKFNHEVESLIKAWKSCSDQLAQIDREESDLKKNCFFQMYENRNVVCPTASVITGGGFIGLLVAGSILHTVSTVAITLTVLGLLGITTSTGVATLSCLEPRELTDYAVKKSCIQSDKTAIHTCVNFLNSMGGLYEKWNAFSKDLSERNITQLFVAFENVQNAEIVPLETRAKEVEKLFLMEDIVRTLHRHEASTETVQTWETFKLSSLTSWGDNHFAHSLEKFGLHQLSKDSYLHFFKTLPFYLPSETQICKKISAAQLHASKVASG